jgi:glycosyltransferase involved in cell wall biosynthesis
VNSRILYTAFDVVPSPKGASTHITYFVRGLVEAGYRVTLITAGDPDLPEYDTYFGATILRAPLGHDLNFLKRALAFSDYVLAHLVGAEPYSLVHFRSIWSGFPLAEARSQFGYKTVYEVNGLPSIEIKYHYPALDNAPVLDKIKEQELATLHLADAVICPSRVTQEYIASFNVPRHKITVIPNGIDPDLFQPRSCLTPEIADLPTLLYLGTLADWQGLATLVAAVPHVLTDFPFRLRIVGRGRGRHRKVLARYIRKLGLDEHISIEPAVPHQAVPGLIRQASLGIAPLGFNDRNVTQGCCPIKLLEYMACGLPVVASNLPVVRELARPDVEALLFTPDDALDLARAIRAVLADPVLAGRLAACAADRAHREFTWQRAQQRLLAVYRSLLSQ